MDTKCKALDHRTFDGVCIDGGDALYRKTQATMKTVRKQDAWELLPTATGFRIPQPSVADQVRALVPNAYRVTDCQTGRVVELCKTLKRASAVADKLDSELDSEYGAVRYTVGRNS